MVPILAMTELIGPVLEVNTAGSIVEEAAPVEMEVDWLGDRGLLDVLVLVADVLVVVVVVVVELVVVVEVVVGGITFVSKNVLLKY